MFFSRSLLLWTFWLAFLAPGAPVSAQAPVSYRFVGARQLTVLGQAGSVRQKAFHRVDSVDEATLPPRVAELSHHSAGINIMFQTNARNIRVRWVLGKYNTWPNITPIAINGLDLYGHNGKSWQFVASARPKADSSDAVVVNNLDGKLRHYRLYLPLYAEALEVEVGVDSAAILQAASPRYLPRQKVVIYGSSITQGASASRPGMAYPSLVGRHLNVETFNMGFSGSGKMELAMADVLAKMPADVYILDCVPNPSPQQIRERAVPFVQRLQRLKPGVPIIMIGSVYREAAHWDAQKQQEDREQNLAFREVYEALVALRVGPLYYISGAGLPDENHEATIDGSHLTDLGFTRVAALVEATLARVLAKHPARPIKRPGPGS